MEETLADCHFFVTLHTGDVVPVAGCTYAECNRLLAVLSTAYETAAAVAGFGVWYTQPHAW